VYRSICSGEIPESKISFVFCNRDRGESIESDLFAEIVDSFKLSLVTFSSVAFQAERREKGLQEERKGRSKLIQQWRRDYDREVMRRLGEYDVHLGILAGYMLIVGEEMCQKYDLINLHPALPGGPKGTWQEVIWQLLENRASETGAMIHLVTPELDQGPALTFCKFSLQGEDFDPLWQDLEEKLQVKSLYEVREQEGEANPLFREIRKHELAREFPLLVTTIAALARGEIAIKNKQVVTSRGEVLQGGYDLTEEIAKIVEKHCMLRDACDKNPLLDGGGRTPN
jgi:folate-dependent phosphoribosylglycinamide formyltransferase PurN